MTDTTLPPEVAEAVEYVDSVFSDTDNGEWACIRAELLRLTCEEDRLHKVACEQLRRAQKAESELAAIKARIAEAPIATLVHGQGDELLVLSAEDADDWCDKQVRLVVEDGE